MDKYLSHINYISLIIVTIIFTTTIPTGKLNRELKLFSGIMSAELSNSFKLLN